MQTRMSSEEIHEKLGQIKRELTESIRQKNTIIFNEVLISLQELLPYAQEYDKEINRSIMQTYAHSIILYIYLKDNHYLTYKFSHYLIKWSQFEKDKTINIDEIFIFILQELMPKVDKENAINIKNIYKIIHETIKELKIAVSAAYLNKLNIYYNIALKYLGENSAKSNAFNVRSWSVKSNKQLEEYQAISLHPEIKHFIADNDYKKIGKYVLAYLTCELFISSENFTLYPEHKEELIKNYESYMQDEKIDFSQEDEIVKMLTEISVIEYTKYVKLQTDVVMNGLDKMLNANPNNEKFQKFIMNIQYKLMRFCIVYFEMREKFQNIESELSSSGKFLSKAELLSFEKQLSDLIELIPNYCTNIQVSFHAWITRINTSLAYIDEKNTDSYRRKTLLSYKAIFSAVPQYFPSVDLLYAADVKIYEIDTPLSTLLIKLKEEIVLAKKTNSKNIGTHCKIIYDNIVSSFAYVAERSHVAAAEIKIHIINYNLGLSLVSNLIKQFSVFIQFLKEKNSLITGIFCYQAIEQMLNASDLKIHFPIYYENILKEILTDKARLHEFEFNKNLCICKDNHAYFNHNMLINANGFFETLLRVRSLYSNNAQFYEMKIAKSCIEMTSHFNNENRKLLYLNKYQQYFSKNIILVKEKYKVQLIVVANEILNDRAWIKEAQLQIAKKNTALKALSVKVRLPKLAVNNYEELQEEYLPVKIKYKKLSKYFREIVNFIKKFEQLNNQHLENINKLALFTLPQEEKINNKKLFDYSKSMDEMQLIYTSIPNIENELTTYKEKLIKYSENYFDFLQEFNMLNQAYIGLLHSKLSTKKDFFLKQEYLTQENLNNLTLEKKYKLDNFSVSKINMATISQSLFSKSKAISLMNAQIQNADQKENYLSEKLIQENEKIAKLTMMQSKDFFSLLRDEEQVVFIKALNLLSEMNTQLAESGFKLSLTGSLIVRLGAGYFSGDFNTAKLITVNNINAFIEYSKDQDIKNAMGIIASYAFEVTELSPANCYMKYSNALFGIEILMATSHAYVEKDFLPIRMGRGEFVSVSKQQMNIHNKYPHVIKIKDLYINLIQPSLYKQEYRDSIHLKYMPLMIPCESFSTYCFDVYKYIEKFKKIIQVESHSLSESLIEFFKQQLHSSRLLGYIEVNEFIKKGIPVNARSSASIFIEAFYYALIENSEAIQSLLTKENSQQAMHSIAKLSATIFMQRLANASVPYAIIDEQSKKNIDEIINVAAQEFFQVKIQTVATSCFSLLANTPANMFKEATNEQETKIELTHNKC